MLADVRREGAHTAWVVRRLTDVCAVFFRLFFFLGRGDRRGALSWRGKSAVAVVVGK